MARKKISETVTENIFRDFYGVDTFMEKSAIPSAMVLHQKKVRLIVAIPIFSMMAMIIVL